MVEQVPAIRLTRRQMGAGLLGAGAIGVASAANPLAAQVSAPALAARFAAVDAIAAQVMRDAMYPGLVIGIEIGGQTHIKGYGMADVEQGRPMSADAVLPIGSVTKSFTALAIAQLIEAGKVSLDKPLAHYIEGYVGPGATVAVRHLLNHTSGIPNYTSDPDFPKDLQRPFKHDEVISAVAGKALLFAPGTRFSYSNTNTYLLGMIIERVSGLSYGAYLETAIFKPFGMTDSRLADFRAIVPRRAQGYALDGSGMRNADHYDVNYPFSAGAIMSSARDMLRYRRGVFGPATPTSVRDRLLAQPPLADGTPLFYTLGCLVDGTFAGHRRISHAGDIAGFGSHYAWYPDDDLTIVVLTNLEHGVIPPYAISRKIARAMLGMPQPRILDLPVPEALMRRASGNFAVRPIEFGVGRYGFVSRNGKLFMKFGGADAAGPVIPLLYQGMNRFVTQYDTEFSFQFQSRGTGLTAEFYDGIFTAFKID